MITSWALFVTVHYLVVVKRCSALFFSDVVMAKKVTSFTPKAHTGIIAGDVSHSSAALNDAIKTRRWSRLV